MSHLRLGGLLCAVCLAVTPALWAGPQKHEEEQPGDSTAETPPALGATPCRNGHADIYPCKNIDLESFMPLEDLGADPNEKASGIWGWTDPKTRHEYALIALRNRVSFVDVTDAKHPRLVGFLVGRALDTTNREVNVYGDFVPDPYAFQRDGQDPMTYVDGAAACECKTPASAAPSQFDVEKLVQTITDQVMASLTMARAG